MLAGCAASRVVLPSVEVSFFIPLHYLPDEARRKVWQQGGLVELLQAGKAACVQCWIYQTWLELREAGLETRLVTEFPRHGMVVALAGNLPPAFRPPDGVYLLAIAVDGLPHPSAQCHVLQNRASTRFLRNSVFMPLWPQPGLLPRDSRRGDRFQNIAFYGDPPNLAPELADPSFPEILKSRLDLNFEILPAARWHDYSQTDAAIAVRSFSARPFLFKPSTKMVNAWLAGIPFLGGMDSAYSSDGRAGTNYLACPDPETMLGHLHALKSNPAMRQKLVNAGQTASPAFSKPQLTAQWKELLEYHARPRAERWMRTGPAVRALERLRSRVEVAIFSMRIS
jgi:hypothetical protein